MLEFTCHYNVTSSVAAVGEVKGGCADLRMWQRVKDGCRCGDPPFTHRTEPRLWTNKRCIT